MTVLVGLIALKLPLFIELREHLSRMHWRVMATEPTWVDHAVFLCFVVLVVTGVQVLARHVEPLGARAVLLARYSEQRTKFFLTYIPACPHYPYDGILELFKKHASKTLGDYTPLCLNELLYMDWVMTSIVEQLEVTGLLDHTLVVITADHGERLGENGGRIGQGWEVDPTLENVPLILLNPHRKGSRINERVASQVDLLPSIADVMGIPLPEGAIYIGCHGQFAMIRGDQFFLADRQAAETGVASSLCYRVVGEGGRTVFELVPEQVDAVFPVGEFERVQQSLLRDYERFLGGRTPARCRVPSTSRSGPNGPCG